MTNLEKERDKKMSAKLIPSDALFWSMFAFIAVLLTSAIVLLIAVSM